eukprot:gene15550-21074_t
MGREVDNGMIENVYRLQIMNTDEAPHRYRLQVSGIDSIHLETPADVSLGSTESRAVPIRVRIAEGQGQKGSNKIWFSLQALDNDDVQIARIAMPVVSTIPTRSAPWYRHRWPWLLMAGPVAVIIAGLVTAWVAFTGADALVVDDYYKQ